MATYQLSGTDSSLRSASFDISPYIANNTKVRFTGTGTTVGNYGNYIFIDNIQIEHNGRSGTVVATVRDEFNAPSFMGNNGSETWLGSWSEINESDGPSYGDVGIVTDLGNTRLRIKDNDGGGEGVQRHADLSNISSATLSFDYKRYGLDNAYDSTATTGSARKSG